MFKVFLVIIVAIIFVAGGALFFNHLLLTFFPYSRLTTNSNHIDSLPAAPVPTPTPAIIQPGEEKSLSGFPFVYQTFNNCGPAALSMYLAYYNVNVSQQDLADQIRPDNNPQGYNDDKSVTFSDIKPVAKEYHLIYYSRPNGTVNLMKKLLANDIPVLTQTWLFPDDFIGHFRILTGFDDTTQEFIQMDSIEGSRRYSYDQFNKLWQPFGYQYAVLVPPEKEAVVKAILGPEADQKVAWTNAQKRAEAELNADPQNLYAGFNLSVADYYLGQYQNSVQAFNNIRSRLPVRMLWYQLEPVQSFEQVRDYSQVFSLTNAIFQSGFPAYSEAYLLRGDAYLAQGNKEAARGEYQKAVLYNKNLPLAKEKLASLGN